MKTYITCFVGVCIFLLLFPTRCYTSGYIYYPWVNLQVEDRSGFKIEVKLDAEEGSSIKEMRFGVGKAMHSVPLEYLSGIHSVDLSKVKISQGIIPDIDDGVVFGVDFGLFEYDNVESTSSREYILHLTFTRSDILKFVIFVVENGRRDIVKFIRIKEITDSGATKQFKEPLQKSD